MAAAAAAGGAAGGLIGGIFNLGATAMAANRSAKEARRAWARNVFSYKHRYQWAMDDLRAAGLNPILAAGYGGGSVGASPAGQAFKADIGGPMAAGAARAIEAYNAKTLAQERKYRLGVLEAQERYQTAMAAGQAMDNVMKAMDVRFFMDNPEWRKMKAISGIAPKSIGGAVSTGLGYLSTLKGIGGAAPSTAKAVEQGMRDVKRMYESEKKKFRQMRRKGYDSGARPW